MKKQLLIPIFLKFWGCLLQAYNEVIEEVQKGKDFEATVIATAEKFNIPIEILQRAIQLFIQKGLN